MRTLLDVNVLIALHDRDRDHVHHTRASHWLEDHIEKGWANCPLTQNGCLRIMSQPSYPTHQPISGCSPCCSRRRVMHYTPFGLMTSACLMPGIFRRGHVHRPRQLNDLYLLALAVQHGGRLVSFDQRIPLGVVPPAEPAHLMQL